MGPNFFVRGTENIKSANGSKYLPTYASTLR